MKKTLIALGALAAALTMTANTANASTIAKCMIGKWDNITVRCGKCTPSHSVSSYGGEQIFWFYKPLNEYQSGCTVTEGSSQTYHNMNLIGIKGKVSPASNCNESTGVYQEQSYGSISQMSSMGACKWDYL